MPRYIIHTPGLMTTQVPRSEWQLPPLRKIPVPMADRTDGCAAQLQDFMCYYPGLRKLIGIKLLLFYNLSV